jgi:hypothetical protein
VEPAGIARGGVEDGQVELVVADDVHVLGPPNNPARGRHVRVAAGRRGRVEVELAELAQPERRQILGSRDAFLHDLCVLPCRGG